MPVAATHQVQHQLQGKLVPSPRVRTHHMQEEPSVTRSESLGKMSFLSLLVIR